ncbi:uncharacterized protein Triagg1_10974 [Trichoderma aggressivum f. europaeum]|uniref:Ankyrin n=1 Tax=Trichoderma aggressivum f. europaeum TaxID=173218 RepID=A0AAE1I6C9_9HYPO|nr:hypothetical protein Triagg1_10974 [Trichoderma aggressivum f. europaeum]
MPKTYTLATKRVTAPSDVFPARSILGICALGFHTFLEGWWDKDIDVSMVNEDGQDLLSIAAKHGHRSLCSDLVNRGSDINRTLESDWGSALGEALVHEQAETATFLLDQGFNPDIYMPPCGRSLLCFAVQMAEWSIEMFLKAGADPNIQCQDCAYGCALEAASQGGMIDSAKTLIKYGADVNLVQSTGKRFGSPLAAAAYGGSLECVKLLIKHGASVNAQLKRGDYGSPLAAAASGPSLECVKLLIEYGADVNAQLNHGIYGSALGAALHGLPPSNEIIKYLVEEAGADASILSSCLKLLGQLQSKHALPKARYLVEKGHIQASVLADLGLQV